MSDKDELDENTLLEVSDKEKEEDPLMVMLCSMNESMKLMSESLKRVHVPDPGDGPKTAVSAKRPRFNLGYEPTPESGCGTSDSDSELLCKDSEAETASFEDDDLLDSLSKSLEGEEQTSAPIPEQLAHIVEKRWHKKLEASKLKEKQDKYLRPENCSNLVAPRVNKPIWSTLPRDIKSKDLRLTQPQQILSTAGRAILKSTVMLLEARAKKTRPNMDELISVHTDILALLGHSSADLAQFRRENIRQSLSEEYKALCTSDIPVTNYLFGNEEDLQANIKAIADANKISKTTSKKEQSQRSLNYPHRARDSRKTGNKSFLRQGYSNKDQNYQKSFSWRKRNYRGKETYNNKPISAWKSDQT